MPSVLTRDANALWFDHVARTSKPVFRLFCFAHAGGNALVFRNWQRYLPPEVELCPVHLPGRGKRVGEQAFTRLSPLVAAVADQVGSQASLPFAFYGHSLGALISFELVRELGRRGWRGPECLFLSGHRAPHLPNSHPRIFNLAEEDFIKSLKELNGTPDELLDEPQTREFFLPVFRADFEIVDTYEYQGGPSLPCPLSVYGGLGDHSIPPEAMRAWQVHTSAECRVRVFSGDHFFVHDPASGFLDAFRKDVSAALYLTCAQRV